MEEINPKLQWSHAGLAAIAALAVLVAAGARSWWNLQRRELHLEARTRRRLHLGLQRR